MSIEGVNRGYLKIEGAVRAFNFDFKDKTVLDIGSSTGGFTELALKNGAKKVIAVEKGSHQMKAPLRFDPRVELHEKTDIFDVEAHNSSTEGVRLGLAPRSAPEGKLLCASPNVIVADVSFLSLTKILEYAKEHLAGEDTDFLVMLKPQFEARSDQLNKGVVKNETIRRNIIKNFETWLKQNGYIIIKKRDNDLAGRHGNLERFYYLKLAK